MVDRPSSISSRGSDVKSKMSNSMHITSHEGGILDIQNKAANMTVAITQKD